MVFKNVKKIMASAVTAMMLVVLFGVVFVTLKIETLSPTFFLETVLIASLVAIVRYFWYSEGEDRALNEEGIKLAKKNYGELLDETITNQQDLEKFLVILNEENRVTWVNNKMRGVTKENDVKYQKKLDKYNRLSGKRVKPITITQILTRSNKCEIITAQDFTPIKKKVYQIITPFISVTTSIVLALIAFDQIQANWTTIFKYITYVYSILWSWLSSNNKGYRTTKRETEDNLVRLTMIVNRYKDYLKEGESHNEYRNDNNCNA